MDKSGSLCLSWFGSPRGSRLAWVLLAYRALPLPDRINNRRLLAGPSPRLVETAQALMEFKIERGLLDTPDDLDGLIDARFLLTSPAGARE